MLREVGQHARARANAAQAPSGALAASPRLRRAAGRSPRRSRGSRRAPARGRAPRSALWKRCISRISALRIERRRDRHRRSVGSTRPPGNTNLPGMNLWRVMALAEQHLRHRAGAVDQDQRRGVLRTHDSDATVALDRVQRRTNRQLDRRTSVIGGSMPARRELVGVGFADRSRACACAHCQATSAPLIGCSSASDRPSVSGSQSTTWTQ